MLLCMYLYVHVFVTKSLKNTFRHTLYIQTKFLGEDSSRLLIIGSTVETARGRKPRALSRHQAVNFQIRATQAKNR